MFLSENDLAFLMNKIPPKEYEISDSSQSPFIIRYRNTYASIIKNDSILNIFSLIPKRKQKDKTAELIWAWNATTNNLSILYGINGYYYQYFSDEPSDQEMKEAIACARSRMINLQP